MKSELCHTACLFCKLYFSICFCFGSLAGCMCILVHENPSPSSSLLMSVFYGSWVKRWFVFDFAAYFGWLICKLQSIIQFWMWLKFKLCFSTAWHLLFICVRAKTAMSDNWPAGVSGSALWIISCIHFAGLDSHLIHN